MKITYRLVSLIFSIVLSLQMIVLAENSAPWSFENGVMTVWGSATSDYNSKSERPWEEYKSKTKKLVIKDGVKTIGDWSFSEFTALEEIVFPNSLYTIGERAFYSCTKLKYINLPNGLRFIENGAFNSCKSVVRIDIPDTLEVIGDSAFMNLPNVPVITIPKSVENIGKWAFMGNTSLRQLYFEGDVPEFFGNLCIADIYDDYMLYFSAYERESWSEFKLVDENNLMAYYPEQRLPVYLNNQEICFEVDPIIVNGRTLVPMRAVFEALGAVVSWDGETETATATKGDITVSVTIGADTMRKNNQIISLDSPAKLVSNRTFVPARAVAEAFGAKVDWNGNERAVYIEF